MDKFKAQILHWKQQYDKLGKETDDLIERIQSGNGYLLDRGQVFRNLMKLELIHKFIRCLEEMME